MVRYPAHEYKRRHAKKDSVALKEFGLERRRMEPKEQRQKIALALMMSADENMRRVGMLCLDPIFKHTSLLTLCQQNRLHFHQVAQEFEHIMKQQGKLRMTAHLPDLMEQTALDARSTDVTCLGCNGEKTITKITFEPDIEEGKKKRVERIVPCPDCHGKGTQHILGDLNRLKMVYSTLGLLDTGKPLVNIDLRNQADPEKMEDVAEALTKVIGRDSRPTPMIDADSPASDEAQPDE